MLGKSCVLSSLLRSWFASWLAAGWIYPLDCVDLPPVILVSSELGDGWATSALWTWEELKLSPARTGSSPWFVSFPHARKA